MVHYGQSLVNHNQTHQPFSTMVNELMPHACPQTNTNTLVNIVDIGQFAAFSTFMKMTLINIYQPNLLNVKSNP